MWMAIRTPKFAEGLQEGQTEWYSPPVLPGHNVWPRHDTTEKHHENVKICGNY